MDRQVDIQTDTFEYYFRLAQRISPETSSKVQLQIVMFDGSTATFHFTNTSPEGAALQERNTVKDMLVKFIQQNKPKPNKELEEKTKLVCLRVVCLSVCLSIFKQL